MDASEFLQAFTTATARRAYSEAAACCEKRLRDKPGDRFALELLESIQDYLENAARSSATAALASQGPSGFNGGSAAAPTPRPPPQTMRELRERCSEACRRGAEAMYSYLKEDEERIWAIGEQVVGIFYDPGQIAPEGAHRQRLHEMARDLLAVLVPRCRRETRRGGKVGEDLPDQESWGSWLLEAVGLLWWQAELGEPLDPELQSGAVNVWNEAGSMEELTGFTLEQLTSASLGDLCEVVIMVWTLERMLVCGLLGDKGTQPRLAYGLVDVLAEIRRRPLIEPPLAGFHDGFYLMTHVVYVLNSYNGHLPNRRADCPWVFDYLERCLAFWLHEAKLADLREAEASGTVARGRSSEEGVTRPVVRGSLASGSDYGVQALDAVSEALDCLRGLEDTRAFDDCDGGGSDACAAEGSALREAATWLLSRQRADGFFEGPGAARVCGGEASGEYDHLHPTWVAIAALQLDRVPGASQLCRAWSEHARAAAAEANFAKAPPLVRTAAAVA